MCLFWCRITVRTLTLETSVHVICGRGKARWCAFERCPTIDNAALFQMKEHSVIVIIMTQGGAFSFIKLFHLTVGLA